MDTYLYTCTHTDTQTHKHTHTHTHTHTRWRVFHFVHLVGVFIANFRKVVCFKIFAEQLTQLTKIS